MKEKKEIVKKKAKTEKKIALDQTKKPKHKTTKEQKVEIRNGRKTERTQPWIQNDRRKRGRMDKKNEERSEKLQTEIN